jgi:hypothetical protein
VYRRLAAEGLGSLLLAAKTALRRFVKKGQEILTLLDEDPTGAGVGGVNRSPCRAIEP